jgi:hypothetical protein
MTDFSVLLTIFKPCELCSYDYFCIFLPLTWIAKFNAICNQLITFFVHTQYCTIKSIFKIFRKNSIIQIILLEMAFKVFYVNDILSFLCKCLNGVQKVFIQMAL